MKRAMINLSIAVTLGFGLTIVVLLMFLPSTQAAPAPPKLSEVKTTPPTIPHAVVTPTIFEESFQPHPATSSTLVTFDNSDELNNWTSQAFSTSHGSASIVSGQVVLSHTNGKVDQWNNLHYTFYRKQPVSEPASFEITLVAAPPNNLNARAGIELWNMAPATAGSGGDRVAFGVSWFNGGLPKDYKLFSFTRQSGTTELVQSSGKGPFVAKTDFPITLRIRRDAIPGNPNVTFSFWYKTKFMSDFIQYFALDGSGNQILTTTKTVSNNSFLYPAMFGSNNPVNGESSIYSQSIFDNFSHVFTYTKPTIFPDWADVKTYGSTTKSGFPDTNGTGQLVLSNGGQGVMASNDDSAGYLLFYPLIKNPTERIPSKGGLTATVQMVAAPTVEGGMGGLEIRNAPSNVSPKLTYGLLREGSQYRLTAFYRTVSGITTTIANNVMVDLATPIWLRATRDKNSNKFSFYYVQKSSQPAENEWTLYGTTTLSDMNINYLLVGLFNASDSAPNVQTSMFDNFTMLGLEYSPDPVAGLTFSSDSPTYIGNRTNFVATITQGDEVAYIWEYGDGGKLYVFPAVPTISHTYSIVGSYLATVTAKNNTSSQVATTTVKVLDPPITSLTFSSNSPRSTTQNVQFYVNITGASTGIAYTWNFGDGSPIYVTTSKYGTINKYLTPGNYTVILTATNANNSMSTSTVVEINAVCDTAISGLTISQPKSQQILVGQETAFLATKSTGANIQSRWDFGDGTIPTNIQAGLNTVKHTYFSPGTYTAIITATNNCDEKNASKQITAYGTPKLAISKSAPIAVMAGQRITYTITVANTGNDVANNLIINDTLPDGITYLSGGTLIDPETVEWTAPSLLANESITFQLVVATGDKSAVIVNTDYQVIAQNSILEDLAPVTSTTSITTFVEYPPVANAGELQGVPPNEQVALDGSGSYDPQGNSLSYQWQQVSGISVTLVGENTVKPIFMSPPYPQLGDLGFRLTVATNHQLSSMASTTVSVTYDPILLISKRGPDVVNPGEYITYTLTISNIGTAPASDVVITDVVPHETSYKANYVSGGIYVPNVTGVPGEKGTVDVINWLLDSVNRKQSASVSFVVTSPGTIINRTYSVDSSQGAKSRGFSVVRTRVNHPPTADAGPNQTVLANSPVTLNGFNSNDQDGDIMTYDWVQIAGPKVDLTGSKTSLPTFTAPSGSPTLRFRLTTTDPYKLTTSSETAVTVAPWTMVVGNNRAPASFSCKRAEDSDEATIINKRGIQVTNGTTNIFIGKNSGSSKNDPIVAKFVNGQQVWCRDDYETTSDDGTGYGLLWDGGTELYGVFNSMGIYNDGKDFRAKATNRWLNSYVDSGGGGRGPYASVIAKIDNNGGIDYATFLTSRDNSQKTSSLIITSLDFSDNDKNSLIVKADADWSPRQFDKNTFYCGGTPPFDYRAVFDIDLTTVITATAVGCSERFVPLTAITIAGPTTGWVNTLYDFKTTVMPEDATTPISYTWLLEPQSIKDTARYSSSMTGTQIITVLASNVDNKAVLNLVSNTILITFSEPPVTAPTNITINGAKIGVIDTLYNFTATVSPLDVTMPLAYTWFPEPDRGQGTSKVNYSWGITGSQIISVMVSNRVGAVSATHEIVLGEFQSVVIAPTKISINGPITGMVALTYTFSITVSPADVSLPLIYNWQPLPNSGQGTSQVNYSWPTPGTYPLSLTVRNVGGAITGLHTIEILTMPITTPTPTPTPTPDKLQANDDAAPTTPAIPVVIAVLANDFDPAGNKLVITAVQKIEPSRGSVIISGAWLVYTPPTQVFTGSVSFTYTIANGNGEYDSALVTVIVSENREITATPINTTTTISLVFTETQSGNIITTTVQLPGQIFTHPFVLVHIPLSDTAQLPALPPTAHGAANRQFILQAYLDGELQETFSFNPPLIITTTYVNEEVINLKKETLHLRYWNKTTQLWSTDGISTTARYLDQNKIVSTIGHLTEFALFGENLIKTKETYLPIILKQ